MRELGLLVDELSLVECLELVAVEADAEVLAKQPSLVRELNLAPALVQLHVRLRQLVVVVLLLVDRHQDLVELCGSLVVVVLLEEVDGHTHIGDKTLLGEVGGHGDAVLGVVGELLDVGRDRGEDRGVDMVHAGEVLEVVGDEGGGARVADGCLCKVLLLVLELRQLAEPGESEVGRVRVGVCDLEEEVRNALLVAVLLQLIHADCVVENGRERGCEVLDTAREVRVERGGVLVVLERPRRRVHVADLQCAEAVHRVLGKTRECLRECNVLRNAA
mmetsp:Transcript_3787/g.13391  ORF Transcript_3787/g.13391 Transcript_3787/m.13391 type:complete len:275 (-) Transcript_3787:302-1126(-)